MTLSQTSTDGLLNFTAAENQTLNYQHTLIESRQALIHSYKAALTEAKYLGDEQSIYDWAVELDTHLRAFDGVLHEPSANLVGYDLLRFHGLEWNESSYEWMVTDTSSKIIQKYDIQMPSLTLADETPSIDFTTAENQTLDYQNALADTYQSIIRTFRISLTEAKLLGDEQNIVNLATELDSILKNFGITNPSTNGLFGYDLLKSHGLEWNEINGEWTITNINTEITEQDDTYIASHTLADKTAQLDFATAENQTLGYQNALIESRQALIHSYKAALTEAKYLGDEQSIYDWANELDAHLRVYDGALHEDSANLAGYDLLKFRGLEWNETNGEWTVTDTSSKIIQKYDIQVSANTFNEDAAHQYLNTLLQSDNNPIYQEPTNSNSFINTKAEQNNQSITLSELLPSGDNGWLADVLTNSSNSDVSNTNSNQNNSINHTKHSLEIPQVSDNVLSYTIDNNMII